MSRRRATNTFLGEGKVQHGPQPEEAAYPQALCRHWASIVLEDLSKSGLAETQGSQPGTAVFAAAERAALGLFPKATHAPVCVDPFQGQQWVKFAGDADRTKFVPGVRLHDSAFPKGSTTIKVSGGHS